MLNFKPWLRHQHNWFRIVVSAVLGDWQVLAAAVSMRNFHPRLD